MTHHSRDTPQFYLTAPSPCPYLPGRHERKVFTHLVGDKAGDLNDLLTHGGFRRSQSIAYRPACDQCRACVSVRVIANEFRPSRNFRKILARNADITGEQRSAVPTSEQYSVFRAYLDERHRHGGMADMTVLDYAMMVEDSHVETRIIEYRRRGGDPGATGRGDELVAVAPRRSLVDRHTPRKAGYPVRRGPFDSITGVFGILARPVKPGDDTSSHPVTKSNTSFAFSAMMMAAVSVASIVSQRGATNGPILGRLAVNITSGTTANGSCRLSTTWLKISNWPVAFSPAQIVTMTAGTMAIIRVTMRRSHGAMRKLRKPSITIWPESVAVMVELSPQHRSAIANNVGAMVEPSNGARNAWA